MTSINMMVQPKARAGYVIADSAVTNPDGTLQRIAGKLLYGVKGFPWALGITGSVQSEVLARALGEANPLTLKQMEKRLAPAMRNAIAQTATAQGRSASDIVCQVKGVVWDFAGKRPAGFMMQSWGGADAGGQLLESFAWYDTPWALGSHEAADVLLERAVDLNDPASFDPHEHGFALVSAQRSRGSIDITPGMEPGHCRIGGEIHVAEVRKTGVQTFVIGEFPDRVGERIAA